MSWPGPPALETDAWTTRPQMKLKANRGVKEGRKQRKTQARIIFGVKKLSSTVNVNLEWSTESA